MPGLHLPSPEPDRALLVALKERRAVATRYDKTAASYAAGITIAASLDWIKSLIR